jgi:hypothetical protein
MPDTDTQGEKDFFTGIAATAGRACGSLTVVRPSETIAGGAPRNRNGNEAERTNARLTDVGARSR